MNPPPVAQFDQAPVHALVKRRGLINRTSAILAGAAVLLAAILILAFLDEKYAWAEPLRLWLMGITAAGALILCTRLWLSGRRGNDAPSVVREMEAAQPAGGQRLRTAWEIAREGVPASATE